MPFHSSVLINFKFLLSKFLELFCSILIRQAYWSNKSKLDFKCLGARASTRGFSFLLLSWFPPRTPSCLASVQPAGWVASRTKRTRARRAHPSSTTRVGFQGVRLLSSSFKEILTLLSVLLFPLKNNNSALTHSSSLTRFSGLWKEGAQKTLYYVSCPRNVSYVAHLDTRK